MVARTGVSGRTISALSLGLILSGGLSCEQSRTTSLAATAHGATAAEACYLGSSSGAAPPRAWLVCIDESLGQGRVLVPPAMLRLVDVRIDAGGRLSFRSEAFLNRSYTCDCARTSQGITGVLSLVAISGGTVVATWPIQLHRIVLSSEPRADAVAGRYSSVTATANGDVVGLDLELFATLRGTQALIVFYESYWGEPTRVLLLADRLLVAGERAEFDLVLEAGVVRYVFSGIGRDRGQLSRLDAAGGRLVELRRMPSLTAAVDRAFEDPGRR